VNTLAKIHVVLGQQNSVECRPKAVKIQEEFPGFVGAVNFLCQVSWRVFKRARNVMNHHDSASQISFFGFYHIPF
jgi:hypothetical protein